MYISSMAPRDRYNAKKRRQFEARKKKHIDVISSMAKTHTYKEIVEATGTTLSFVERVIREEGLRK